jgi:hypothetical protein
MTRRRRTPVGTEPPQDRPRAEASWLDGSWLEGLRDGDWPEGSQVADAQLDDVDPSRVDVAHPHPFARGSNHPRVLPRAITSEPTGEAAGTIDTDAKFDLHDVDARVEAHKKAIEKSLDADKTADQEQSVIVQVDEDWLARLDLPPE